MPSAQIPHPNWNFLHGLFIVMLFSIFLVLLYTLISDYYVPQYLSPFEDKGTALTLTVAFMFLLLIVVAPGFIRKQLNRRSKI